MGIESELCREKGKSNWDIGRIVENHKGRTQTQNCRGHRMLQGELVPTTLSRPLPLWYPSCRRPAVECLVPTEMYWLGVS